MRTILYFVALGISVMTLAVACGKKKGNSAAPAQTQTVTPPGTTNPTTASPTKMVIQAYNGGFILVLPEGNTVTYQGMQYQLRPEMSYFIPPNSFQTVYQAANGARMIITGTVSSGQMTAGNTIAVSNVSVWAGPMNSTACTASCAPSITTTGVIYSGNTRNGFSPMRTAAYDECREFFPVELDSLSSLNRQRRHECQAKVASETFADEVDWRDTVFSNDFGG